MNTLLFENLVPLIKVRPIKVGRVEIKFFPASNNYTLYHDGLQWMTLNCGSNHEIKQQFVEINMAQGNVVTTGLGFGLLQSILCQKETVLEVRVYEKNEDVIRIFEILANESGVNIDKIKIFENDANELSGIECDWLVLDHYEAIHQPMWEIVGSVKEIASNNNAKNVWFWPMFTVYPHYCLLQNLEFNRESYSSLVQKLKIKNFVSNLPDEIISKFEYFKMKMIQRKGMTTTFENNK